MWAVEASKSDADAVGGWDANTVGWGLWKRGLVGKLNTVHALSERVWLRRSGVCVPSFTDNTGQPCISVCV